MKKKYRNIIKNYFSDYVTWLIVLTFLFIVSFIAGIAFNGLNWFIWIIALLFVIIFLFSLPLFILYTQAKTDFKNQAIEKDVLRIVDLQIDRKVNLHNNGGAIIGKIKYRLIDEVNNSYLLCAPSESEFFSGFQTAPDFFAEIEYLKTSKIVLSMRIPENQYTSKEFRKQLHNINLFKGIFKNYF